MTSRERILCAISHREPDRVPRDLGATQSSGITAVAYNNLARHLAWENPGTRIYDVVQQLALPDESLLDRFRIDVLDAGRVFHTKDDYWKPFALPTPDGRAAEPGQDAAFVPKWFSPAPLTGGMEVRIGGKQVSLMLPGSMFFDQMCFPYADGFPADFANLEEAMALVQWGAFAQPLWQDAREPGFWKNMRAQIASLRARTDRAITLVCGCNLFEWGTYLRGLNNFLCDIAAEPETVARFLDAIMERHLAKMEKVCAAAGDLVDIVIFGETWAWTAGRSCSPKPTGGSSSRTKRDCATMCTGIPA